MDRRQDTGEQEQWERRLVKMENDVVRGTALQRLIADEQAAVLAQPKQETEND